MNENIINFLWIGDALNNNCILTLKSFLDHEHDVHLWAYNKQLKNVPDGVIIKDANDILPSNKIFSYKGRGDCKKGSYGGFSDIFRYHLIHNIGGWYCDMDVTCLKNFSDILPNQKYIIRPHNKTNCVANIFKAPKNNKFLKRCIEETESQITENNEYWVRPLRILNKCVQEFKFEKYIVDNNFFGNDDIVFLEKILSIPFKRDVILPTHAIHWCNQMVSTGQWYSDLRRDWDVPFPTTLYHQLLKKHKIIN
jgi:hypothetical protein